MTTSALLVHIGLKHMLEQMTKVLGVPFAKRLGLTSFREFLISDCTEKGLLTGHIVTLAIGDEKNTTYV